MTPAAGARPPVSAETTPATTPPSAAVVGLEAELATYLEGLQLDESSLASFEAQATLLRRVRRHPGWPAMERLVRSTFDKHGHVVLQGVPVDNDTAVVALCLVAGSPQPQLTPDGERLFFDVRSLAKPYSMSTTADELELHTDTASSAAPDRVLALACRQADPDGGGVSRLLRAGRIRSELERRGAEHVHALESSWFSIRGAAGALRTPLLWQADGLDCIRWRSDLVKVDPSVEPACQRKAVAALSALREVIVSLAPTVYRLRRGDLLLLDNWTILHGRTEFAPTSPRFLRRLRCPPV
jgi:hypothetical protein